REGPRIQSREAGTYERIGKEALQALSLTTASSATAARLRFLLKLNGHGEAAAAEAEALGNRPPFFQEKTRQIVTSTRRCNEMPRIKLEAKKCHSDDLVL